VVGLLLIALGMLFLVQQALGLNLGHYGWPLFIIVPGVALLAAFALGGRSAAGLAVPGCVVSTVGLLLLVMNAFSIWQTWAYAWGLIVAAVGLGLILQGVRLGQTRMVQTGTRMLEGGVLAFVAFGAFFELIIDLSHIGLGSVRGVVGPAVLIVLGTYLLLRRGEGLGSRPSGT